MSGNAVRRFFPTYRLGGGPQAWGVVDAVTGERRRCRDFDEAERVAASLNLEAVSGARPERAEG
jgi:hypothetical protein